MSKDRDRSYTMITPEMKTKKQEIELTISRAEEKLSAFCFNFFSFFSKSVFSLRLLKGSLLRMSCSSQPFCDWLTRREISTWRSMIGLLLLRLWNARESLMVTLTHKSTSKWEYIRRSCLKVKVKLPIFVCNHFFHASKMCLNVV